jgi:hypothetical protein
MNALLAAATALLAGLAGNSTTVLTTNGRTALTYTGYMNGESFQQDGIVTYRGQQYAAFWDQDGYVNLSRRRLPAGAWQSIRLTDYATTSTDSHNTISIGISGQDGAVHLAFDMHSSQLRYRRSIPGLATQDRAWSPASFGAVETSLAGTTMDQVTYPQFLRAPDGTLQLAIRTGLSGAGDETLYEYARGTWTHVGRFLEGTASEVNPYLFGIEYDAAGLLHVTWTVRETPDASTNHDLFYAYSRDKGRTWRTNAGAVVGGPLTADASALRVWGIGQNRGLINQESQVVDRAGVVHVLASQLPATAPDNTDFTAARESAVLVHYWRDKASKAWHQTFLPIGEGSSRGDIGVDAADNLYVVSGHSTTRRLSVTTAARASGWTDWAVRYTSDAIYYSDPLVDHERLRTADVLSVFAPRYGGSRIDVRDWATRGLPGRSDRRP